MDNSKSDQQRTRREFLKDMGGVAVLASGATLLPGCGGGGGSEPLSTQRQLELTATDAVQAIKNGDVSAEAYVTTLLDRHDRLKSLNTVISLDRNAVLEAARGVDNQRRNGTPLGALAGLPLLIKDNIDVAGVPCTAGSRGLATNRPQKNAPVMNPLLSAGALVMAKGNMHELAFGITSTNSAYGFVKNPYNTLMIPGGSSGGPAAAVAARIAPAGLGTDTGGSMRIPPALCGVVGLRPTVGNGPKRYPGAGVVPISHTRDTVGSMARTVADVALLDSVITSTVMPTARTLTGLRIGIPRAYFWEDLDPELAVVMNDALKRIASLGVVLVEVDLVGLKDLNDKIGFPVALYEANLDIPAYLAAGSSGITFDQVVAQITSKDVQGAIGAARTFPQAPYDEAINIHRPQLQKLYADYFINNGVAAMLFPTTPLPARPINQNGDTGADTVELNGQQVPEFGTYIRNTDPGSNAGLPGLSMPAGMTKSGLPVGMELDGPVGSDQTLLAIGMALEKTFAPLPAPNV